MKQIELGNTGEKVSAFCLGTRSFVSPQDEKQPFALLDQFVEAGGNFVDTANLGENNVGQWMQKRRNRGRLFVAAQAGLPGPGTPRGTRAEQIITECEKSLKRLQADCIDLYYAPIDDRSTPAVEILEAFSRLVKCGKVRYIGAGNFTAWRLEEFRRISINNGFPDYCCVRQLHTYLRPRPGASLTDKSGMLIANDDLLDYCESRPFTLVADFSLLNGAYDKPVMETPDRFRTLECSARLAALKTVANEHSATPNQVVLAWMLRKRPKTIPLVGVNSRAQLAENLGALSLLLSDSEMEILNSVKPPAPVKEGAFQEPLQAEITMAK